MDKKKTVATLMQKEIKAVPFGTTIVDAVKLMASHDIGSVIVLNAQEKPVGLFTERDLVRRVIGLEIPVNKPIESVMTGKMVCVKPEDTVEQALKVFDESRFRHLPVIDENERIVGMISMRDVVHELAHKTGTPKPASKSPASKR